MLESIHVVHCFSLARGHRARHTSRYVARGKQNIFLHCPRLPRYWEQQLSRWLLCNDLRHVGERFLNFLLRFHLLELSLELKNLLIEINLASLKLVYLVIGSVHFILGRKKPVWTRLVTDLPVTVRVMREELLPDWLASLNLLQMQQQDSLFLLLVRQDVLFLGEQVFKYANVALFVEHLSARLFSLKLGPCNLVQVLLDHMLLVRSCLFDQGLVVGLVLKVPELLVMGLRNERNLLWGLGCVVSLKLSDLIDCVHFLILGQS